MATFKQYEGWLPGFNLPVNWPMPSAGGDASLAARETPLLASVLDASEEVNDCWTVRERTMIALMNELTDMPTWERKIFDSNFTFKWKSAHLMSGRDVTRPMTDWCVEEVKSYVKLFYESAIVPAVDGGVVKSDTRVSGIFLRDVQRTSAALRGDFLQKVSQGHSVISNVVDPFLCPFSWEAAKYIPYAWAMSLSDCLQRYGEGSSIRLRQPKDDQCREKESYRYPNDQAFSKRFQWLPFEVEFDNHGEGGPRITSYVNNVHPMEHRDFYMVLETLIATVIPMFNQSLMESRAPHYQHTRIHVAVLENIGTTPTIYKDVRDFSPPQQLNSGQFIDREHRWLNWLYVDLKKEFWSRGLQMVCEVQEFDLDPDQSSYEGEEWHVQGQRNEYICATAILTYSVHNVTQPRISFRRRVFTEEAALAWAYISEPPFAPEIYGAKTGDPDIQHIGDVDMRQGRLITFPNIWQTRLLPCELADKSKPGYFKILVLHLIDPNRRIISTSRVPPQRRDWWAKEVRRQNAVLWRLPNEIWAHIVAALDGYPLSREETEHIRDEFVEERAEFQRKHTEAMMAYGEWDLDSDAE